MPLHELFQRLRTVLTGSPPQEEAPPVPMVPAAEYDAGQTLLAETRHQLALAEAEADAARARLREAQRSLAVAEQRSAILVNSNRTAARAIRRFLQDRDRLAAEREAVEVRLTIAVGERAIAVGDRQRTMILNDRILSDLRDSEEARRHLEDENRHLRRQLAEYPAPAAPSLETDRIASPAAI